MGPRRLRRARDRPVLRPGLAQTQFTPPADVPWETDVDGGQALAEFTGRACYQSWGKPNPATATNQGYLRHILEVGHLSRAQARHRQHVPHAASPVTHARADPAPALLLQPAVAALRPRTGSRLRRANRHRRGPQAHERFLAATGTRSPPTPSCSRASRSASPRPRTRGQQAHQAARSVLPNATETARRHRQLQRVAALRRHAGERARRRRDPRAHHRLPARAAAGGRVRVRRLPDQLTRRRHGVAASPFVTEG